MSRLPDFRGNDEPTLGVELELMLLDPRSLDLCSAAVPVQRWAAEAGLGEHVKLEITQSMIELNSSVHVGHRPLRHELLELAARLQQAAQESGVLVCGGGTHPFHRWQERTLSPTHRFQAVGRDYGYLAKQFTVFGQHVHVGCRDGDDAVRVARRLSQFVPQLIALAGSSPFHRGVDTSFDSCRLNMIAAFPLTGHMPALESWREFEAFFDRLETLGIVSGIKDLYWDVRPQPRFGTVEIRVPDTPLEVTTAADLAAYAQVLVEWSRSLEPPSWLDDFVYRHNRFHAARFGFEGRMIVGNGGERLALRDHLRYTFGQVKGIAARLGCTAALERLAARAAQSRNDAAWLREQFVRRTSLPQVMKLSAERWVAALAGRPNLARCP